MSDDAVVTWRAGRAYVAGPLVITALLLGSLALGVVSRNGWLVGGLVAVGIAGAGSAWAWALHRMFLSLTREELVVQNVVRRTHIPRDSVLAVESDRNGVRIWYRTGVGPAVVTAAGAQGLLAGDFRRSRAAAIATALRNELDVEAPGPWLRRNVG